MDDRDPRSDADLLAATAQDPEAFGVFYRRNVRWVLAACARRAGDAELAADVTAEVFAAADAAARPAESGAAQPLSLSARRRATARTRRRRGARA